MNCEFGRDGSVFYNVELIGSYDGCRLDIVLYPNGEMLVEIDDERTKKSVDRMRLKTEMKTDDDGEIFVYVTPLGDEEMGETLYTEDGETWVGQESRRGDLLHLSAWWLSENVSPIVNLNDRAVYEKDKGKMPMVVESMVGISRLSDFYEGVQVPLSDGSLVQTAFAIEDVGEGKFGRTQIGLIKIDEEDKENELGFINGRLYKEKDGGMVLVVDRWESVDDYDHTMDLLAFQLRFLQNTFPPTITVVFDDRLIMMDADEVSWRTSFWLGF